MITLKHDDHVVLYKILKKILLNELSIPKITECIKVDDNLDIKLFYKGCSAPLPPSGFKYVGFKNDIKVIGGKVS